MRRSATLQSLTTAERKPVDECADYLLHYKPFLKYDEALAAGLPIATGVIEGACRHLVKDRVNVTGARWRVEKPCSASARYAQAETSTNTGSSMKSANTNATTWPTMRANKCLP